MKLSFSTKNINTRTFSELCNLTALYGYSGIEIYDTHKERAEHSDSVLHSSVISAGKRKLLNRSIAVTALTCPTPVALGTNQAVYTRYIEHAMNANVSNIIVSLPGNMTSVPTDKEWYDILMPSVRMAEEYDISILFETNGLLSKTENLLEIINNFASSSIGASWNVRETYFNGGESPDDTIQSLGAYIKYVRLGDRKDDTNVILGEGTLPLEDVIFALYSLNYDSYVCVDENDEIKDPDIILTHFAGVMNKIDSETNKPKNLYYNRSHTGTYPWKKYDVIDLTFSQVLDEIVLRYPDRYAFRYTTLDYTRTYSQFRDDVDKTAAALISLGVKPGYHVAIWATNIPQWFITFWATVKIGAVLVTVNTAYKIHETEYLLRQSDTHTLVMIEDCKDSNYKEIMQTLCPELENHEKGKPLYSKKFPFLRNIITVGFSMNGCLSWDEMEKRSEIVPQEEVRRLSYSVKPDDVCNMQYTSGTTGFPKGVMLTHRNIINNGKIIGDRMDMSTADRMMIQVPMFHCFGMVLSMTSMMTHGGTLSPMPYFSPKSSLCCITDEKITCFNGVPTMFIAMFSHPDFAKTDFSHIRTGIMAGSNCPPELMRRAADEMNMKEILSVYGQTESSPGCTMGEVNEPIDLRVETVGSAFPGVECKIIDPETGVELPDGENGEFVARGFNIMKGYYKMPGATHSTIDSDGWLHTGDICMRTKEGYYKVTGRLKDMIIRGGENIYPREIEEFYLTHPGVSDVQVIGVPDQRYGEESCAWIIAKEGITLSEDEMRKYGEKNMAKHKVPRYFVFAETFPMNAAGKILKYKMREMTVELLNIPNNK